MDDIARRAREPYARDTLEPPRESWTPLVASHAVPTRRVDAAGRTTTGPFVASDPADPNGVTDPQEPQLPVCIDLVAPPLGELVPDTIGFRIGRGDDDDTIPTRRAMRIRWTSASIRRPLSA